MKILIVLVALVAVTLAAPAADVETVRLEYDVHPEGYKFGVETSDGFKHDAEGQLKDSGTDHEALAVHGSYSFIADDGQTYTVNYVADENGFQPEGAHLPNVPIGHH